MTPGNNISGVAGVVPRERILLSGQLMSLCATLIVMEVKRFPGGATRVPNRLEARGSPFLGVSPPAARYRCFVPSVGFSLWRWHPTLHPLPAPSPPPIRLSSPSYANPMGISLFYRVFKEVFWRQ